MIELAGLVLFNLIFFRRGYANPYRYATSEPLDTAYPSMRLLGEWYSRGCRGEVDPYYYAYYTSIPFLSSFYPPHVVVSILASKLSLDTGWCLYLFTMFAHFLFGSIGAYILFGGGLTGLFAGITLGYMAYNVKQNSCINYTVAWTPWLLLGASTHNPVLFGTALGMGTLAGYWPLYLYAGPIACLLWFLV